MPLPADHPACTDPALAQWKSGYDSLCPDAEVMRVLRHLPGRRVTSQVRLVGRDAGRDAVLKIFATPRARGNDRRLTRWKASAVADIVPAPLGADVTGHVGLVEFLPGEPLDHLDGIRFVAALEAAGDALRRLHRSGVELDRSWTLDEELGQLERRMTDRASTAVRALLAMDVPGHHALVSAHRDCHPAQAVIAATGGADGTASATGASLRWIDLDDAAMAPAGLDLGNLVAHLRRDGAIGTRPQALVDAGIAALQSGYGAAPEGTEQWEWLSLARLACLAEDRHRRPDWADLILSALARLSGGVTLHEPSRFQRPASPRVDVTATGVGAALDGMGLTVTAQPVLIPTGHADRPVYRAETGRGPVAVKCTASDSAGPHRDLLELWDSSFGRTRRPPGLAEPLGWSSAIRAVVTDWLPGTPLARRGEPPPPVDHLPAVAVLVADLHASGVRHRRHRDAEGIMRSTQRKAAELGSTDLGDLAGRVVAAMARRLPDDEEMVPTHGDFSPRNVMVTADGPRLIDFDRLQLSDPARDVCYYGAWLWTTGLLHDGHPSWRDGETLIDHYLSHRPAARLEGQLEFHRAAALMRIVHGWTVLRRSAELARPVLDEALRILRA